MGNTSVQPTIRATSSGISTTNTRSMNIHDWHDTWGTIDWKYDSEEDIIQKIKDFYNAGVDFNMPGGCRYQKPLDLAAYYSTPNVIKELVAGGANIAGGKHDNYAPLHCAIEGGKLENVKYIIKKGPKNLVNKTGALLSAARSGKAEIVRTLIKAGADIEEYGERALTEAVSSYTKDREKAEITKILIDAGVDVNDARDLYGSVWNHVVSSSDFKLARTLIELGVDAKNYSNTVYEQKMRDLIKNAKLIRTKYVLTHPHTIAKRAVKSLIFNRQYS